MSGSLVPALVGVGCTGAVLILALAHRPIEIQPPLPRSVAPRSQPLDQLTIALVRAVRRPVPEPVARRRLRRWAALALAALPLAPPLALAIPCGAWVLARRSGLRHRRQETRALIDSLPDAVDLLLLATSAGRSLPLAHPLVAARLPPPLGPALQVAAAEADAGRPRVDAILGALVPLGARATALGHALGDHLRYGAPLAPPLERLGMELRLDRRRLAEERARRVPVRLLAPLVVCILPALGLLTVVPLLVGALRSLPT